MQFIKTFQLYDFVDTLISLFVAFVFGTLIGAERQYRQRSAGLRTNVLVCVGAAAFVDLADHLAGAEGAVRVIAYVVSGIGFPAELLAAEQAGVIDTFATWNPVDLGYSVAHMLAQIVTGRVTDTSDTSIEAGRIGEIKLGHDGTAVMGDLTVIDKTNIDQYAKLF